MSFRSFKTILTAAVLAGGSAWFAQGQSLDSVFTTKGGAPSKGTVTEAMTRDEVTLDMAGVPRKFPANEISRITYGDEPNELTNARNSVVAKNYNAAIEELRKLTPDVLGRAHMKQDADFYRALCEIKLAMTEGGDKAKADAAMKAFLVGSPNSYHYYEAAELVGDLALSMGKYEDAVRAYSAIATRAPFEDYQMRANNSAARALVANKNFAEALTKFQAVLDAGLGTPEATQQKMFATIGKAQCLGETGKPDEGIKMLEDIIQKNDPADAKLFARTYNALGACHMKAGRPKDAVQAYLHTDVLFYSDGEAHAEALYWLNKLWTDLNRGDRAITSRNTLRERYAGSLWNSRE
jgi:tetratricopeptide (TPR) repeat protein